jgi:hypothetical protein
MALQNLNKQTFFETKNKQAFSFKSAFADQKSARKIIPPSQWFYDSYIKASAAAQ